MKQSQYNKTHALIHNYLKLQLRSKHVRVSMYGLGLCTCKCTTVSVCVDQQLLWFCKVTNNLSVK